METTSLDLFILPEDASYFGEITDSSKTSSRFPGLLEIHCNEVEPSELDEFGDRKFFGYHGSYRGSYGAQSVCCNGNEHVYAHASDESGALSLSADPWDTASPPIQIPTLTLQYLIVSRGVVASMLDIAAAALQKRISEIEAAAKPEDKPVEPV